MSGRHARVVYDLDAPALVVCEATNVPHAEGLTCDEPRPVDLGMCAWFALCPNPASTTQSHPILGDVPICASCAAWYASLS